MDLKSEDGWVQDSVSSTLEFLILTIQFNVAQWGRGGWYVKMDRTVGRVKGVIRIDEG